MSNTPILRRWCVSLLGCVIAWPVQAGDPAWTDSRVSTGLHILRADVVVTYAPTARDPRPTPGAQVTRVHAARHYRGDARVTTRLCWRSLAGPCIDLPGSQINTHAFDGLAPEGPFILVHQALDWVTTPVPLFIQGSVTVWFSALAH
ncbi:MAG TPA: hypothetical protein VL024_05890 [Castellaniella sp.]|nr:hypothetical protein [Castellaniella sp.]